MKFFLNVFIEWVDGMNLMNIYEILWLNLYIIRIGSLFEYMWYRS